MILSEMSGFGVDSLSHKEFPLDFYYLSGDFSCLKVMLAYFEFGSLFLTVYSVLVIILTLKLVHLNLSLSKFDIFSWSIISDSEICAFCLDFCFGRY